MSLNLSALSISSGSGSGTTQVPPTVANFAALPASGPFDGALYETLDNNDLYAWNAGSSSWIKVGGTGVALSAANTASIGSTIQASVISSSLFISTNAAPANTQGISHLISAVGSTGLYGYFPTGPVIEQTSSVLQITGSGLAVGATLAIQVNQASGSTAGYLSPTDWTTFNNKQPLIIATKTLYVDVQRTDIYTATGSIAFPFKTIAAATSQIITNADNVTYRYQVLIACGVYSENITLNNAALYNVSYCSMNAANASGGDSAEIVNLGGNIISTSANDQLKNIEFNGITITGSITLTGASNATTFGLQGITFANCTIYLSGTAMLITNAGDILFQLTEIRTSSGTGVMTFTNVNFFEFNYSGVSAGTLALVTNGGNAPSGFAGTFGIVNYAGMSSTTTIDAGSELDYRYSRIGSSAAKTVTNNGLIKSFNSVWTSTLTANSGSVHTSTDDSFVTNPTFNAGSTVTYPGTINNVATKTSSGVLNGSISGAITQQANATTTNYTVKWPNAQGGASAVLQNDGSGNLSWGSVSPVLSVGPFSYTSFAQGATLFGATLQIGWADATNPGSVGTTNQIFAGIKTFNQGIDLNAQFASNGKDPVSAQQLATKNYVDIVASGLNPLQGTYAGSTTNIVGTYLNGVGGIGAIFTVTATGTFTIDGVTPPQGSRILLKDQTTGFQNGVYDLTNAGALGVSPILTRSFDYDTPADVDAGDLIPVINGTVNTKTSWLQTATVTTIGTDALVFVQWTANPASYLLKANNLSDVVSSSTSFNNISPMTTGGDIIYGGASGAGTRLANGSANNTLISGGGTNPPTWGTLPIAGGGTGQTTKAPAFDALSPMTTGGDIIYGGASGTGTRLPNGNNGDVLTSSGGTSAPTWAPAAGGTKYSWTGYQDQAVSNWNYGSASFADPNSNTANGNPIVQLDNNNFGTVAAYASGARQLPGITFTPPVVGRYRISAVVGVVVAGSAGAFAVFRLTDGVTVWCEWTVINVAASAGLCLTAVVNITSLSSITYRIEGYSSNASAVISTTGVGQSMITWSIEAI